ncbi:histidinol-phosphate transaminase [Selenomonas sp. TAMA-11512]|uniref:histidinol-phosphate transaminase n=1 Tax=Selenomonas sp. TAMA-11512 TaxID=3095337 RepID=UPI00308A53AC|nr:histidinol-phosphate transaminase [Selenomonas sp. TAMA-11512]
MLRYRAGLADMPRYDVVERDWRIKVNANESTLNMPPMVEDRLLGRLAQVAFHRYPNEQMDLLREQIGSAYGFRKENVIIGAGSSEIIEKVFHCFGGSGQKIVYPMPSFSMYNIYAKAAEAQGIPVDLEEDFSLDVRKFIDTVNREDASLAVICNPNNPTGNVLTLDEVEEIAANIACAFLLDEAYMEFYGESATKTLLAKYPNMMVARTFSKAYGLAGVRVGYMLAAADIIRMLEKAYMPYYMNVLSLVTADTVFQMRYEYQPRIDMTIAERKRMQEALSEIKAIRVYPSAANFILIEYDKAKELQEEMEAAGIGVRCFASSPRLKNCLRISMGTREENDAWYALLKSFAERNG